MRKIATFILAAGLSTTVALLPSVSYGVATRTCANGSTSHAATQQEADSANAGGIIVGETQLCPEDAALGVTAQAGQAKEFLNTTWCGGKPGAAGGYVSNVEQLDAKFAVCIANFVRQYRQKDP